MIKNPHLEGDPFYWRSGPVGILLIHGFTASTAEVRLLAEFFFERGYSIGAPLLPGHNTKPEDLNEVHWKDWVAASVDMYDRLNAECETVFVGGESTGGLLALYLAHDHPEISGILTYAPALRLTLGKWNTIRLQLLAPFIPYIEKSQSDDQLKWRGYSVYPLKGTQQLIEFQRVVEKRLPGIFQPILIIQGRQDQTVHPTVPETIYTSIGSSYKEIHWMENSTHCVILDKEYLDVAEITDRFMDHVLAETNH